MVRALSLFILAALFFPANASHDVRGPIAPASTAVNAVVGDVSFVEAFGRTPNATDDEDLRLRTHLRYVEGLLRARDVSHLTATQRSARATVLDELHEYHEAGFFPRNRALPGRRPRFVDLETGALCAVGYLMEQTVGRDVVLAVNEDYEYAAIAQIDLPLLDQWLATHGLTRIEAAMIQPFYSFVDELTIDTPGHLLMLLDGSGPGLGNEGHTVRLRLANADTGAPVVGYPRQDIWLDTATFGEIAACVDGMIADADTDANGETVFTSPLAGGGWTDETLYLVLGGVVEFQSPLDLTVNSPDLNADRRVDLVDVGLFASDFSTAYAFRSDIGGDLDGILNLLDVGRLAQANGTECP